MIRKSNGCYPAALALAAAFAVALAAPASFAAAGDARSPAVASAPAAVNLNTATLEELTALPGIGEKRAQAILEMRKQKGGFKSIDELAEVKGIGPANLEKLRPYLRAGAQTP
jgi:competence protein ComEA